MLICAPFNQEEAAAIASAARFGPVGSRGFGSTYSRDAFGWSSDEEYRQKANAEIIVAVMIETRQGYENAEAIINTPGIGRSLLPLGIKHALGHGSAH